jgi:hypothetical protein
MLMNWHGWPPQQQGVTQLAAPGAPRLGAPWTHMSAGSNDTSLCAVVMPTVGPPPPRWGGTGCLVTPMPRQAHVMSCAQAILVTRALAYWSAPASANILQSLCSHGMACQSGVLASAMVPTQCSAQEQDRLAAWHSCELRYPTLTPRPVSAPDENASLSALLKHL